MSDLWKLVPESEQNETMSPDARLEWVVPAKPRPASRRTYRLPLTSRTEAILQLPSTMDIATWDQMMSVFAALKPGIVAAIGADDE